MLIFLIGYMGSGKSKLGKKLSSQLGITFADTDQLVAEATGFLISDYFKKFGEEAFRKEEAGLLRKMDPSKDLILATGGGLPCYEENMQWMNSNGLTIYLKARPGLLYDRLLTDRKDRPLIANLSNEELLDQIQKHLKIREPFYNQAHFVVPIPEYSIKDIAELIRNSDGKTFS